MQCFFTMFTHHLPTIVWILFPSNSTGHMLRPTLRMHMETSPLYTLLIPACTSNSHILSTLLHIKTSGPLFSYKLRYIVGFGLVEMSISTNPKPTIYRNLYENTDPDLHYMGSSHITSLFSSSAAIAQAVTTCRPRDGGDRGVNSYLQGPIPLRILKLRLS